MRPAAPSRPKQPVWGAGAGAARAQTLGDATFQRRTCTYLMSAWYSSFSRWFQTSPSRGPARTCRPPRGKHHKCHPPAKESGLRTVSSGIFFTLESVPLSQVSMIAASQRQRVGDTPEAHGRKALPTSIKQPCAHRHGAAALGVCSDVCRVPNRGDGAKRE